MPRKITNAYEAFWFISQHPKFRIPERQKVTKRSALKLESQGHLISVDKGGTYYRYYRHCERRAIDHCLDIHYAMVNERGRVDKDKTKNRVVECWLEFGTEYYGYMTGGGEWYEWDDTTGLLTIHDTDLDCGGATFDEALIKLAKKILKHYGDFPENSEWKKEWAKECAITVRLGKDGALEFVKGKGKVPCADCDRHEGWKKKQGIKKKEITTC